MLRKKDFWVVNNKGNVILLIILLLNILVVISSNVSSKLNQILYYQKVDVKLECLKIKAIQRIEKEFKDNDCEDFTIEENNKSVIVTFDDIDCHMTLKGDTTYEMIITYDDVFRCIENIEYINEE